MMTFVKNAAGQANPLAQNTMKLSSYKPCDSPWGEAHGGPKAGRIDRLATQLDRPASPGPRISGHSEQQGRQNIGNAKQKA